MTKISNDNDDPDLQSPIIEFGARIIERVEAIKADIEYEGTGGLLSLIGAAIDHYGYNHQQLLTFGKRICPPGYFDAYRELLDRFKGNDRLRCLWTTRNDGTYALVA